MDERLAKQWKATESVLRQAATEIKTPDLLRQFEDFLSHNELGLALSELSHIGETESVSALFWWWLKKAAQLMGLNEDRKAFMKRYQQALLAETALERAHHAL